MGRYILRHQETWQCLHATVKEVPTTFEFLTSAISLMVTNIATLVNLAADANILTLVSFMELMHSSPQRSTKEDVRKTRDRNNLGPSRSFLTMPY